MHFWVNRVAFIFFKKYLGQFSFSGMLYLRLTCFSVWWW